MSKFIYLTFDLEEFDIPLEYGCNIPVDEQMEIGKRGLDSLVEILNEENVNSTFFVTGNFASTYPSLIRELSVSNEIASHSFYHSSYTRGDLINSKEVIEKIIEKKIYGLRMPRMQILPTEEISEAGFAYDSSIHPTYLPSRYNNLGLPTKPYYQGRLLRIPASVSPFMRIPLFWLSFKNFPFALYKRLCTATLRKNRSLVLYFHPWEFTDVTHYELPYYICNPSGDRLLERLDKLIVHLKNEGEFSLMRNHLS